MFIPIPGFAVPYLILILNCFVFKVLRSVLRFTPSKIQLLVSEFIATLELCADCAELGVVWEKHGDIAYGITLLLVSLWWCKVFGDAEACPCGPFEDCVLLGTPLTSWTITQKIIGQVFGAYITAQYTGCLWCFHLVPEHEALHSLRCQASLNVSVIYGALIEAVITFISRIVALESSYWSQVVSDSANSITTVILCLAALRTSGGFFNPILASALALNCEGNTLIEHVVVYWIGSLLGGLIARRLHIWIRSGRSKID